MSDDGTLPPDPWPPAFSASYLASATALLEQRGALLVVGPPGSNRASLVEGMLRGNGAPTSTWHHRSRLGDKGEPFHALRAFAAHLGCDASGDGEGLMSCVRAQLRTTHHVPPTAVLTEVDFCDPESLTALATLAVTQDVRVVVIATRGTLASAPQFTAFAERLDVVPLGRDVVARLVADRFGAQAHRTVSTFLTERSQGSYAALRTVADAAFEAGLLTTVEGVLVLDPAQLDVVRRELPERRSPRSASRLGNTPGIVDLLQVVSVMGEVEQDELVGVIYPADLELALQHGALTVREGIVTMSDPLEAEAVVALMGPSRMSDLWRWYGSGLPRSCVRPDTVVRNARWCLESGNTLPPDLAAAGATDANLRGLYARAVQLTEPGASGTDDLVAPAERAYALRETGDLDGLRELYRAIDPAQVPEDDLLAFFGWAADLDDGPAGSLRERALAATTDPEARRRRDAVITLAGLRATSADRASGELVRATRTLALSGVLSPVNQALAYSTVSTLLRHAGHAGEAVESARIAVSVLQTEALGRSAVHLDPAREALFRAHLAAFDVAAADEVLDEYAAAAARYGGSGRLGHPLGALLELYRGNVPLALASTRVFLAQAGDDLHGFRGWVEAMAAHALVVSGRTEEGSELLAQSEAHPPHAQTEHDLERRLAQASTHDVLGDPDRALELIEQITADAHDHGLRRIEIAAAGMAVMIDGPAWLGDLLTRVESFDGPDGSAAVWRRFARAAHAYDFVTLTALAVEMYERQNLFFATRVAQYVLDSARRATDLDDQMRLVLDRLASGEAVPGSERAGDRADQGEE